MHAMPRPEERFREMDRAIITDHQEGVITSRQALAFGHTPGDIRWKVQSGRWQAVYRGVYATFSGKLSRDAKLWAAVLRTGDDAALSHETAAERLGFAPGSSEMIHVTVPAASDPARWSDLVGVVVHRSTHWRGHAEMMFKLPVTPGATTVLDLVESAETLDDAFGWVSRAVAEQVARPESLALALAGRKKFARRRWLNDALADIADGVTFPLERRWVYDVERPHGLPRAVRQAPRSGGDGTRFHDSLYEPFNVPVELDGLAFHPPEQLDRERRRANETAIASSAMTLRYGFKEVANRPCVQAEQVARALIKHGWDARKLKACQRPGCAVELLLEKRRAAGAAQRGEGAGPRK
jgi:hypothetical protein